jgi:hypothetical protein
VCRTRDNEKHTYNASYTAHEVALIIIAVPWVGCRDESRRKTYAKLACAAGMAYSE